MTEEPSGQVTAKLFVGFLINSEVKMHLNDSSAWRNAKAIPSDDTLIEVRHQGCDYIGYYLKNTIVMLMELKEHEKKAQNTLKSYCPQLPSQAYRFVTFSQLFIQ